MTDPISRRHFVLTAGSAAAAPWLLPDAASAGRLDSVMERRMRDLKNAIRAFDEIAGIRQRLWDRRASLGMADADGCWEWYVARPESRAYYTAERRAQVAAERAFMTPPVSEAGEDAIMEALELYARIAPSAFAVQTARDLFTPGRFQAYSHDGERDWLLNAPDEAFEKSPVPAFLTRMRAARQLEMA